jgi:hypothetical protein
LRMTIAGHMRTLVDYQNFVACLRERTTDNSAAKSSTNDAVPHRRISDYSNKNRCDLQLNCRSIESRSAPSLLT